MGHYIEVATLDGICGFQRADARGPRVPGSSQSGHNPESSMYAPAVGAPLSPSPAQRSPAAGRWPFKRHLHA